MDTLEAFNQALFLDINATLATPIWQIYTAVLIADYLIWLIPLLLVGMWLSGSEKRRTLAIRACLVAMLALGVNQLIGFAWHHPRPFMIGLGHTFLHHAPDSSFPSDHVTIFSGIALTLLLGASRRLGLLIVLSGLAVAWARVFVGVHFPLDMIGAVAVACATYALVAPLWKLSGTLMARAMIVLYRKLLAWPIARGWLRP
ncbi:MULTISPECIES: phosphatase PAP2 family protein [Burkholderia]|uniref:Phosphatase PAP2 family protein n=1 Tax=Burkholderia contaminans TaxID=488447 RepID=A0A3N8RR44_9BURK|nr:MULTISPECIES: phosphatase PAP2 family protein [Burkholderia]MDD1494067.1 phosphatase PAP2 family protein [Burkholderia thailandensis]RQT22139.1 phosphatase PAP2 family protein [Burkholderia contaminans]